MKSVTVTYSDGRTVDYKTMRKASKALGCSCDTLVAFSNGLAPAAGKWLQAAGVASVRISQAPSGRRLPPAWNASGHAVPVLVTCEATGETVEVKSMRDAYRLTGIASSNIKIALGDGRYHKGWRFDLPGVEPDYEEGRIVYGDTPVPDDLVAQMRSMAIHYIRTKWSALRLHRHAEDDAVDDAVARAAAEYSQGKYDKTRGELGTWAYMRVKYHAMLYLRREMQHVMHRASAPPESDADEWLEHAAGGAPSGDADEEYLAELPAEHRELARLILAGHERYDICRIMGKSTSVVLRMRQRLGDYIRARRTGSDSG